MDTTITPQAKRIKHVAVGPLSLTIFEAADLSIEFPYLMIIDDRSNPELGHTQRVAMYETKLSDYIGLEDAMRPWLAQQEE